MRKPSAFSPTTKRTTTSPASSISPRTPALRSRLMDSQRLTLPSVQKSNPFSTADIFAVAGPQEFSVVAAAEPIHVKNFGRAQDAFAHFQPVAKIVSHVVATEGQHGHGIAAHHTNIAGCGGGGFAGHAGA